MMQQEGGWGWSRVRRLLYDFVLSGFVKNSSKQFPGVLPDRASSRICLQSFFSRMEGYLPNHSNIESWTGGLKSYRAVAYLSIL